MRPNDKYAYVRTGGSMKRALLSILALAAIAGVNAQSNFTIVRPADGSKIRETVRILFPMNSVDEKDGFVGIFLNGKFLEAVKPMKGQQYLYYELNTKQLGLPDGPLTLEAVLYQDFAARPRILDRSSVQLNVQNSASIPIPDEGLVLKYKFKKGQQWVYSVQQRFAINTISEAMANSGTLGDLLTGADVEHFRLAYSVDNTYPNGDGLVRIQAIPDQGKDYTELTTESTESLTRYSDYQLAPVYMRLKANGSEVFGSIPEYFPMIGSQGELQRTDLFAVFPLPVFNTAPRKPGGTPWESQFQVPDLDLEHADTLTNLTTRGGIPARGEFVGVEWEGGHPCAHLRNTLATKAPNMPGLPENSRILRATKMEEDIFFALDLGAVTKMTREYTIDAKQTVQVASRGGTGGAGGGVNNTPRGPMGAGSTGGSNGGAGSARGDIHRGENKNDLKTQGRNPGGGRQGGPPTPGPGGIGGQGGGIPRGPMGAGTQGQAGTGQFGGASGQTTTRIVRISIQLSFTLEK